MNWKAIFKWGLVVGLGIWLGLTWSNQTQYQKTVASSQLTLKTLKSRTHRATSSTPSVKLVQNDYSKGLRMAKLFLQYQQQLHNNSNQNSKAYQADVKAINHLVYNPQALTNPLINHDVGGWDGKIYYGGENNNRQVAMAYRFYAGKQLMYVTTFYYDAVHNQLTSFVSYPTYAGQRILQQHFTERN